MANIFDYLDWRADVSFSAAPFNEVDNLILDDLYRMRQYNPEYLTDIEYELGIYDKEYETEDEI